MPIDSASAGSLSSTFSYASIAFCTFENCSSHRRATWRQSSAFTLFVFSSLNYQSGSLRFVTNPFAAMPSLHFGYAVFVSVGLLLLVRSRWVRVAAVIYPAVVLVAIIVTGNHFLFDVLAGALVIAVAYLFTLSAMTQPEAIAIDSRDDDRG